MQAAAYPNPEVMADTLDCVAPAWSRWRKSRAPMAALASGKLGASELDERWAVDDRNFPGEFRIEAATPAFRAVFGPEPMAAQTRTRTH